MAERFTPGPWKRDRYGQVVGVNGDQVRVANLCIAHVSGGPEADPEELANSEIMLAATDLYEALKSWFDYFDQGGSETGSVDEVELEFKRLMSQSRAALSKAHPTQGDE